ncbi:unnamed protein product [Ceratitis capitata]|uniref:(Mediterranean fruit fly) hypothetical protein n=1 Tax=Ceratitis capitata TaxID=7213 RepID=A0A811U943_CERCA|nr:unnamed protein product [Ceratitis capitata]
MAKTRRNSHSTAQQEITEVKKFFKRITATSRHNASTPANAQSDSGKNHKPPASSSLLRCRSVGWSVGRNCGSSHVRKTLCVHAEGTGEATTTITAPHSKVNHKNKKKSQQKMEKGKAIAEPAQRTSAGGSQSAGYGHDLIWK